MASTYVALFGPESEKLAGGRPLGEMFTRAPTWKAEAVKKKDWVRGCGGGGGGNGGVVWGGGGGKGEDTHSERWGGIESYLGEGGVGLVGRGRHFSRWMCDGKS